MDNLYWSECDHGQHTAVFIMNMKFSLYYMNITQISDLDIFIWRLSSNWSKSEHSSELEESKQNFMFHTSIFLTATCRRLAVSFRLSLTYLMNTSALIQSLFTQPSITLLNITAKLLIRQLCNFHIISIWPQRKKRTTLLL